MIQEVFLAKYLDSLLQGDRGRSRAVVEEVLQSGLPANRVYADLIWLIMLEIDKLTRADKISPVQEHLAMRINRAIVDQLQNKLPRKCVRNRKVVISSGCTEAGELGAQIIADLFEADGWQVRFIGGGLTNDDILAFINEYAPDILLIYGTTAAEAPAVRRLIDNIRGVNAWPEMKIMLSGGLFDRAEGLWEEIGGDLYAVDAVDALRLAGDEKALAEAQPNRTIKRRRKRQPITADG